MPASDQILIQYIVPMDAIAAIPHDVQRSQMQLGGSLCPMVHQSWGWGDLDSVADLIAPGFRPPAFRGEGTEMQGRDGDWVVTDAHAYYPADGGGPYGAIVVCTVAYSPVPESSQAWSGVEAIALESALELA